MATKQFYATGDFRYGTRMLRAGDGPVTMDGPTARLYAALGKITEARPRAARVESVATEVAPAPKRARRRK